jgi:hypothetical protein
MTRKHFIALAEVCADNNLDDAAIYDLAKVCQRFNSSFSRTRFFDYIRKLQNV